MHADLVHGQKTGIFLDQRENYLAAARYARGRALDCFTSSGGFALHMAARCDSVEAVDSSEASLKAAELNRAANQIPNVEFREADVFEVLAGYASARRRFETVVLDPPAFAKSRDNLDRAVSGYKEINRRALELLGPGGVLITCSCSHHLKRSGVARDRGNRLARYRPHPARTGAPDPEPGPSNPPDSTRDAVPQVPDSRGNVEF